MIKAKDSTKDKQQSDEEQKELDAERSRVTDYLTTVTLKLKDARTKLDELKIKKLSTYEDSERALAELL
jgi:uncharacterized transporter YbjL